MPENVPMLEDKLLFTISKRIQITWATTEVHHTSIGVANIISF
ncbi:oxidoreductase, partial [Vibrio cholerae]|nr:oxidoreductase [Vibrio cholerae]